MLMRVNHSIRAIARQLGRAPSTISRELVRHTVRPDRAYDASLAGHRARLSRCRPRRCPKLTLDSELFELVVYLLRQYWSLYKDSNSFTTANTQTCKSFIGIFSLHGIKKSDEDAGSTGSNRVT